uniref:Synaptotagmin IV n=1 Tax=Petromyzon marinus TaxID=7757 RepID=S4RYC2_PETMA
SVPTASLGPRAADTPSVLFGVLGVLALVLALSLTAFVWVCCQRAPPPPRRSFSSCSSSSRGARSRTPYRFVHMLKSAHIYPETLGERRHPLATLKPLTQPVGRSGESPRQGPAQSPDAAAVPAKAVGAPVEAPELGTLSFSLQHDERKEALLVHVKEARGLPPADELAATTTDPCVKLLILPERRFRGQTRVLRGTRDPVFDETFAFYGLSAVQMEGSEITFAVLSFGRLSREEVIGEVTVPLAGIAAGPEVVAFCRHIVPRGMQKPAGVGELLVSLSFTQADSRLTVVILKARGLHKRDTGSSLGAACVKVSAFAGSERVLKRKTRVRRASSGALFNESFEVALGGGATSLELLVVVDSADGAGPSPLGRVVLGAGAASPRARQHWQEVRAGGDAAGRPLARWHALQPC